MVQDAENIKLLDVAEVSGSEAPVESLKQEKETLLIIDVGYAL